VVLLHAGTVDRGWSCAAGKEVGAHFPSGWSSGRKLRISCRFACAADAAEGAREVDDLPAPRMLPVPRDEQVSARAACRVLTSCKSSLHVQGLSVYKLILVEEPYVRS
jgi:hypothetical protein